MFWYSEGEAGNPRQSKLDSSIHGVLHLRHLRNSCWDSPAVDPCVQPCVFKLDLRRALTAERCAALMSGESLR